MLPPVLPVGQLFLPHLEQSGYPRCCPSHLDLAFGSASDFANGVLWPCPPPRLCPPLPPCPPRPPHPMLNAFGIAAPVYGNGIGIVSCCICGTGTVICAGGLWVLFNNMAAICCTNAFWFALSWLIALITNSWMEFAAVIAILLIVWLLALWPCGLAWCPSPLCHHCLCHPLRWYTCCCSV